MEGEAVGGGGGADVTAPPASCFIISIERQMLMWCALMGPMGCRHDFLLNGWIMVELVFLFWLVGFSWGWVWFGVADESGALPADSLPSGDVRADDVSREGLP